MKCCQRGNRTEKEIYRSASSAVRLLSNEEIQMKLFALILVLSLMNVTVFAETQIHCTGIAPGYLTERTGRMMNYEFTYNKKDGITVREYVDEGNGSKVHMLPNFVHFWKQGPVNVIGRKYSVPGDKFTGQDLIALYRMDRHNAILRQLHGVDKDERIDNVNLYCD
jgi:hypothetical protein